MKPSIVIACMCALVGCDKPDAPAHPPPGEPVEPAPKPEPTRENQLGPGLEPRPEPRPESEDEFALMNNERFGELRVGLTAAEVKSALGDAKTKTPTEMEPATGEYASTWAFPDKGVVLSMGTPDKDGEPAVLSITITDKSALKTSRGIGIGSTEAELDKAYGDDRDTEAQGGPYYIAGSIFGGVAFKLKAGKVSEIFVGAMAE